MAKRRGYMKIRLPRESRSPSQVLTMRLLSGYAVKIHSPGFAHLGRFFPNRFIGQPQKYPPDRFMFAQESPQLKVGVPFEVYLHSRFYDPHIRPLPKRAHFDFEVARSCTGF
jgi:hypothetical protein